MKPQNVSMFYDAVKGKWILQIVQVMVCVMTVAEYNDRSMAFSKGLELSVVLECDFKY